MKAFVSVDMEGMPHVVIPGHLTLKGTLYEEARKIATNITLIAADELNKNGFEEILIADSHGPMVNLLVDDLPEYVEVIRGYPRPLSMVAGIESRNIALFLGYHAKFGTARSTFDHTYSSASIMCVEVNGVPASEFLLNSYVAGEFKVPVALVAGEAQLLTDDVNKYAPWAETIALKHSLSRLSARSPSMKVIESDLRKKVRKATTTYKQGKTHLLKARKPVKMRLTFLASHFADAATLLPIVERIDGLKIEYSADCMVNAYKTFELLALAASGMSAVIENLR
jgi:D-amino peptidase